MEMLPFEPRSCVSLKSTLKAQTSAEERTWETGGSLHETGVGRIQAQVSSLLWPMSFLS